MQLQLGYTATIMQIICCYNMGNNSTTCISIYADTGGTYRVRRVWCIYYTTWVSKYIMFTIGAERVFQRQRAVFQFGREPKRERKEENTTERREMRSEECVWGARERHRQQSTRRSPLQFQSTSREQISMRHSGTASDKRIRIHNCIK